MIRRSFLRKDVFFFLFLGFLVGLSKVIFKFGAYIEGFQGFYTGVLNVLVYMFLFSTKKATR